MVAIHLIHVLNGGLQTPRGRHPVQATYTQWPFQVRKLNWRYPAIDKSYVPRISMVLYGSVLLFCPEIPMK